MRGRATPALWYVQLRRLVRQDAVATGHAPSAFCGGMPWLRPSVPRFRSYAVCAARFQGYNAGTNRALPLAPAVTLSAPRCHGYSVAREDARAKVFCGKMPCLREVRMRGRAGCVCPADASTSSVPVGPIRPYWRVLTGRAKGSGSPLGNATSAVRRAAVGVPAGKATAPLVSGMLCRTSAVVGRAAPAEESGGVPSLAVQSSKTPAAVAAIIKGRFMALTILNDPRPQREREGNLLTCTVRAVAMHYTCRWT